MAKVDNKDKMKALADKIVNNAPMPPMQERNMGEVKPVENDASKEQVQFSFYLAKDLLYNTKNFALKKDLKINKVISLALTEYLEKHSSM